MTALLTARLFASVPEAAGVLGIDVRTLRRAIARGEVPATKVGVRTLIPTAWIRAQARLGDGAPAA
jgi:excisionase family DNA binding protein